LLQDSSDESAADVVAVAAIADVVAVAAIAANVVAVAAIAADVVAVADNAADVVAVADVVADNAADVDENTGDDASDLEPEPTVPKASTTKKVAVPKTSKKRGPRGPYKKKIQQ
jgi:hypothetical protein